MTNKELLLDSLMKEYARAIKRGAELDDKDEYLDGVYDGEAKAYAFAMQLVRLCLPL
jgi:hypothetical protein